jgi:hypothetical protein
MAIIGLHFAAQPAQVQNRVDLAQEMIVRNHLFQIEVIEKTILSTNRLAHHRRDPSAQTFMSKESHPPEPNQRVLQPSQPLPDLHSD